jgi:protein-tyrosine-phosphatase
VGGDVRVLLDFGIQQPNKKGLSVPDPWGHGADAFEEVYQILDDAVTGFLQTICQKP